MTTTIGYTEVLDFWYAEQMRKRWFASTPALDTEIREKFEAVWERASREALAAWEATPEGALALVIVLDQLPLNMFRGQAKSFSTERLAIEVAKCAIQKGFDKKLPADRLAFLYMPLMHSESLADQDLSVKLFTAAGLEANLRFAEHHRNLIRRFGRFPHRNVILGRDSLPEELEYLASAEAFKG